MFPEQLMNRIDACAHRAFRHLTETIREDSAVGTLPGWDSLGHLTFMMEIEEEFGLRFTSAQIAQPKTIRDIAVLVLSNPAHE